MSNRLGRALFAGLVFTEEGLPAQETTVGGVPHYAIPDRGFLRHVEADYVDRQIIRLIQERLLEMQDIVTEGVLQILGQEDIFTRASVRHAIENLEQILEPGNVDVDEFRTALWMTKFKAIVNVHGDVVRLESPAWDVAVE